jgi:hypothetical protein
VAGWEGDVSRRGFADWAERKSRSRARARRRREKYVRKSVVDRYVAVLNLLNDPQGWSVISDDMKRAVMTDFQAMATQLRDVERLAIDERLGISGVPTNLEFRR